MLEYTDEEVKAAVPTLEQLKKVEANVPRQVNYICTCGNFITTRPGINVRCNAPGCTNFMEEEDESK